MTDPARIRFRKPLTVKLKWDSEYRDFTVSNTAIGLYGGGPTPAKAMSNFMHELAVSYDGLAGWPNAELTLDAQIARDKLAKLVEIV
jgi:hypothetical protein